MSTAAYGLPIGQNVAAGYRSWIAAMGGWSEEVDFFSYGNNTDDYLGPGNWTKVAHYTQVCDKFSDQVQFTYNYSFPKCRKNLI